MTEGLRERKKRQTREAIADAALRLFQERGFEAVTVADVARAADVSEKTVFNHFATKEDLVFHRGAERRAELVEAVRNRPAGASLVEPFRVLTEQMLDGIEGGEAETIVAVPRLVRESPALLDRLLLLWEQEASALAPAVADAAGLPRDDLVAAVMARTLSWTHRLVFRAAFTRLLAGEDPATIVPDLREQAGRAYDLLESGIPYGSVPHTRAPLT
jgi:AcrR family transcriptional regulator